MNELPRVYENKIDKEINKNQTFFYGSERNSKKIDINKKIDSIFNSFNHVYKSNVRIITDSGVLDKVIVGKTRNSLITIDGELLDISIIDDIEKI